jgi:predicted transcriptional regulator
MDRWGSTPHFEQLFLNLANAFTQLARTRLTEKQLALLKSAKDTLRYHPSLSPTVLAEQLSNKLDMPLSTVKFNLRVLLDTGLLKTKMTKQSKKWRNTVTLSYGGQLLSQLLLENHKKKQ